MERGVAVNQIAKTLKCPSAKVESCLEDLQRRGIIGPRSRAEEEERREISPVLTHLWLEVTGRCNLNCIHCYAKACAVRSTSLELKYNTIVKAIREGVELGCTRIQFTGGEPTLRRDLKKLILQARDYGVCQIEVFSNGFSLPEALIDFFAREEVRLAVSFYSHREKVHDSITRVKGSYRKTLKNFQLIAAKDIQTRCEIILMKANRNDFLDTCELLSTIGINVHSSHPIIPIGRGISAEIDPNWDAYLAIIGGPPFYANIWEFQRKGQWNDCWDGKAAVTFNGDVLPCIFARDQVAGNLGHEGLPEIIKGKMLVYWGMNKDKVDVCRDCEYRYNCGDCPPLTYSLTGSLTSKPPYCRYDPYSGILKQ